jgi:putative ABC transport system substrate-binding protein
MKKIMTVLFFCSVFVFFLFYFKNKNSVRYKIALLQTASHPALNTIAEVLISDLKKKYKNDIAIVAKNGEGSLANIDTIANQLMYDDSYQLYVGIGSPAVQSLARLEKERPIVFGAVTDASILGIDRQKNVCGFLDQIDYDSVITSLLSLFSDKTIGVLYGVGDLSSEYTIRQLEHTKLNIKRFGCIGESELIANIQAACQSSDIIFLPTDNMIASAIKIVIDMTKKYNKSIFMTDTLLFELGGSYAQGIDYKEQGKEMVRAIESLLEQKNNVSELGIKSSQSSNLLKR